MEIIKQKFHKLKDIGFSLGNFLKENILTPPEMNIQKNPRA
jgi:hypothetical protein